MAASGSKLMAIDTKGKKALSGQDLKYITALTDPQIRKLLKQQGFQPDLFDEITQEVEHNDRRLVLRRNDTVRRQRVKRRQDKLAQLSRQVDERNALVASSIRAQPEVGLRTLSGWAKRHKLSAFVTLSLEGRQLKLQIDESQQVEAGLLDGCYVLETDVAQDQLDAHTINQRYRDLQKVERDFRTMKTTLLEIRPIFVRKKSRTYGHVVVAWLALKLARELERGLKAAFGTIAEGDAALTVKDALHALSRLCFQRHQTGDQDFLTLPQPDPKQERILNAINVKAPSLTPRKSVMM